MTIQGIRTDVARGNYEISYHAEKERYAEDISIGDLERAIADGSVIEDYPDDPRGPSCLVLGNSGDRAIHVVCGRTSAGLVRIITVYIPMLPKWIDEKTRIRED